MLKKPYEIAVYDDVWVSECYQDGIYIPGHFKEVRLCVIGTNDMEFQGRALEPTLTTNVNGTKSLKFNIYRYFTDTITGEKVENPFYSLLISERKVKLHYKNKWYDFVIKSISENSTNYLYSYQLEDSLVSELSKNGFGKIFNEALNNNVGSAKELVRKTLEDTDWSVSEESEEFVQIVEEELVYLQLKVKNDGLSATHILDQIDLRKGVDETNTFVFSGDQEQEKTYSVMGFYSSCRNKPYRFQFIYIPENETFTVNSENRLLTNKDCQYFIDLPTGSEYPTQADNEYGFYLPSSSNWSFHYIHTPKDDTTVSNKYRGGRYGYSQQAIYLPELERYVNKYIRNTPNGVEDWYGYEEVEYHSPETIVNHITNPKFDSTSGWIAGKQKTAKEKPEVESLLGSFENDKFISFVDALGSQSVDLDNMSAFLKVTFTSSNDQYLFNTGPSDNKYLIGYMAEKEEWALKVEAFDPSGRLALLDAELGIYVLEGGDWYPSTKSNFSTSSKQEGGYKIFTIDATPYKDKQDFKNNSKIRIAFSGEAGTYYIKKALFFKVVRDDEGNIIEPSEEISLEEMEKSVTVRKYYYFPKPVQEESLKWSSGYNYTIQDKENFVPLVNLEKVDNFTYEPVFNTGAIKVRSIEIQESNYFNILQTISETFGGWLVLQASRDVTGAVVRKEVVLKNYLGKLHNAKITYGVNLKNIQRTYESKGLVTKLIVKNNNNQLAENGFCTIQRSKINPTGENYIYDFQYFLGRGLLDTTQFTNHLFNQGDAKGKDISEFDDELNLQGYFPRLRKLNDKIIALDQEKDGVSSDFNSLNAKLEIAKQGYLATTDKIVSLQEDFLGLTGYELNDVLNESAEYSLNNIFEEYSVGIDFSDPVSVNKIYITDLSLFKAPSDFKLEGNELKFTLQRKDSTTQFSGTAYANTYVTIGSKSQIQAFSTTYTFEEKETTKEIKIVLGSIDFKRSDINSLILQYKEMQAKLKEFKETIYNLLGATEYCKFTGLNTAPGEQENGKLTIREKEYTILLEEREKLIKQKEILNKAFYSTYSRFIQEGTWINEEYVDDDKYYYDARSVAYNSCHPKVAYTINLLELSALPGYEMFEYELGDRTYVVDPEFFGSDMQTEIVITQLSENLDSPEKNVIQVQNFKNQFQDLFQKITATVQQAQYSQGSYEKAVALAEASNSTKMEFLSGALSEASTKISAAGQQSVTWGVEGITVTDVAKPTDQIRMVGGAIMLSKQDPITGEQKWSLGMTADGISANKITAGTLNANEIAIMNGKDPLFRWDAFGISAFDFQFTESSISSVNPEKFVRFDKHGIYGVNQEGVSGLMWKPNNLQEIDQLATFALTWDGLKVTGEDGTVARMGKLGDNIFRISKNVEGSEEDYLTFSTDGKLTIGKWSVDQDGLVSYKKAPAQRAYSLRARAVEPVEETEKTPAVYFVAEPREESIDSWVTGESDLITLKAGDNFMVSQDGTMYANAGYIGPLKIEEIPDDGYVASIVNNAFSWKFSPTDGMFMWNGEQEPITDENPTGGAVLAVYKDGDTHKLSMRGHIEAESGIIGPLSISQQEGTEAGMVLYAKLPTISEDFTVKTGELFIGTDGINIKYVEKDHDHNTSDYILSLGDGIHYETPKERISIDGSGLWVKTVNDTDRHCTALLNSGIEFRELLESGYSTLGAIVIADNEKSLVIKIGNNYAYVYFNENGKPVLSDQAPKQNE